MQLVDVSIDVDLVRPKVMPHSPYVPIRGIAVEGMDALAGTLKSQKDRRVTG